MGVIFMLLFFIPAIDNVKFIYSGFPIFRKHIEVGAFKRAVEKWAACLDYQIILKSFESVRVALILDDFVRIFFGITCFV
jgi:hypothetical protein